MIDAEDILKGIGKIIKHIVVNIFINIFLFYLGFFVLKTFTLWKYPSVEMTEKEENVVIFTGAFTPIFLFGCFFMYNNFIT